MSEEVKEKLNNIAKIIVKKYDPEKIILFGSHAWGEPNKDSDIDLYIVKNTKDIRNDARKINRLLFSEPFSFDILVNSEDNLKKRFEMGDYFVEDILNKGKVLYEKK